MGPSSRIHRGGRETERIRGFLVARDGPVCARCRGVLNLELSGLEPWGPTVGHVIPVSRGGTDDLANLRLEHRKCNLAASDRSDPPMAAIVSPLRRS